VQETTGAEAAPIAPQITEVILALDPDLEGDTTVLYLAKALQEKKLKISRIASGVPLGSDIDYVDDRTLGRALENRVEL
jgi:recombination protein RecR